MVLYYFTFSFANYRINGVLIQIQFNLFFNLIAHKHQFHQSIICYCVKYVLEKRMWWNKIKVNWEINYVFETNEYTRIHSCTKIQEKLQWNCKRRNFWFYSIQNVIWHSTSSRNHCVPCIWIGCFFGELVYVSRTHTKWYD